MFYPSLKEFTKLASDYNLIPVYTEIQADCETPVSAFLKLAKNEKYCYLLESVEGSESWGRYSFISWSPKLIFSSENRKYSVFKPRENRYVARDAESDDPLSELREYLRYYKPVKFGELPRFFGGAVGFCGYEMIHNFEDIPKPEKRDFNLPDCTFMMNDIIVIIDHFKHKTKIVICADLLDKKLDKKALEKEYSDACRKIDVIIRNLGRNACSPGGRSRKNNPSAVKSNMTKNTYMENVRRAKKYIYAGDIIQTVLSQRFRKTTDAAPFDIYRCLRTANPSPYMYYLNFGGFKLIGSSPEILVRKEGGITETRPIAGTRPRGRNEAEDRKFEAELLGSAKEKAEHIMLVDLGRNDIGKVCENNTVRVNRIMEIEKYSHVMHMVSNVTGKLKKNMDSFDVFRACFPAGTVSGAPKIRAMQIISEIENVQRGTYAGAVGYFSYTGNMDMCINIRTILYRNKTCYVQAGAGIVADSNPAKEHQETVNKAKALFVAINQAEENDTRNR